MCKFHGGKAPQVVKKAKERLAEGRVTAENTLLRAMEEDASVAVRAADAYLRYAGPEPDEEDDPLAAIADQIRAGLATSEEHDAAARRALTGAEYGILQRLLGRVQAELNGPYAQVSRPLDVPQPTTHELAGAAPGGSEDAEAMGVVLDPYYGLEGPDHGEEGGPEHGER